MKFIKKYRTILILLVVCLLLMVLAAFAVYRMFYPSNDKSVYGDRLNGAPTITEDIINKIKEEIEDYDFVESFKYRTSVKTMVFNIDVASGTKIDKAQKLSEEIINNLTSDIIDFYDISLYLTQKDGDSVDYPAIGYSSKGSKNFMWTLNKEVSDSEE